MTALRLTVLAEIGDGDRPHASPYVRLIRPLSHPALAGELDLRFAVDYHGEPVDAVVVDRLWGPWVTRPSAADLLRRIRAAGARLIFTLDDNLLDRRQDGGHWPTDADIAILEQLATEADGILVSTEPLAERMAPYNARIAIVPNALDERLVVGGRLPRLGSAFDTEPPVVIGWMGTRTHDADLAAIAPALHEVARRHGSRVRFECVGVLAQAESRDLLDGLNVHYVTPRPQELEYPLFMLWFTSRIRWDIGLAALADTPFTRGKSDLKSLDYAAIGAAGVYSDVPAYRAGVVHGETGWLAANHPAAWVAALDQLVTDAALRERLATAAARELYAHRTLARRAGDWLAALQWLLDPQPTPTPARRFGARILPTLEPSA